MNITFDHTLNENFNIKNLKFLQIPIEKRINIYKNIKFKFNDRIPIILTGYVVNQYFKINFNKFLVEKETKLSNFLSILRNKYININSYSSLYYYIVKIENNNILFYLISLTLTFEQIHDDYKSEDGFVYILIEMENSFG